MIQTSLTEWRAAGDYFSHRGHRIFWRCAGHADAPVLLLIRGYPTASWDWEALWPELARRYRVLTLDMIGFGFSDKPIVYEYSILDQADIAESLLRSQAAWAYHVLAHDYGDTVAQELLARQSEHGTRPRLCSVCFLNGGLFPETHRPVLLQRLLLSPLGSLIARRITKQKFADTMTNLFGTHMAERYRELVPNPDVTMLPDIGHYPQVEAPREVLRAYLEFRDASSVQVVTLAWPPTAFS